MAATRLASALIRKAFNQFLFLFYAALLVVKGEIRRIRLGRKMPETVLFETEYAGQPILLLALYERGNLRQDIMGLLAAAKDAGLYVLAVNTLKVSDPDGFRDKVDCYIERVNYGRDFGSYKTGFLHLFAKGWQKSCPRLLMVNDSVFYTQERAPKFLDDMFSSPVQVLGATENYEIEYHLGSFCIAMANKVLNAPAFATFWRQYRLTMIEV